MRILRVHPDKAVTEHEVDEAEWMGDSITWDFLNIDDKHDIWVNDEGLFLPTSMICKIGNHHVALPVVVTGVDGEKTVSATMTIQELESMLV